jgi:glycine/D-amino acid oxidase-like deaminating enzyme
MRRWTAARCVCRSGTPIIALQSDVRVYLACGYTGMRKGIQGLAMLVQQVLAEDPVGASEAETFWIRECRKGKHIGFG